MRIRTRRLLPTFSRAGLREQVRHEIRPGGRNESAVQRLGYACRRLSSFCAILELRGNVQGGL